MPNLVSTLFSFQGRTTRTVWWISAVGWWIFVAAAARLDNYVTGKEPGNLFAIAILLSLWPLLAIQVKRWHDRNKSALWILIGFVPIIGGIWALIELGFLGPVDEGNSY